MRYELKPRSMSELMDGTFKLYRDQVGPLLAIAAITDVPTAAFYVLAQRLVANPATVTRAPGSLVPLFAALSLLPLMLVAMTVQAGALASATADAFLGRPWSVGGALRKAFSLLPGLLWAGILWLLGLSLGFLLFILPCFYLGLAWAVWIQALVVEGKRGGAALSRSRALTKGAFGRLGWLLLAFGVVQIALFVGMAAAIPSSIDKLPVIGAVLSQIPNVVMAPLYPALFTLVYFDGRIRHEGYDLEVAAREEAPAASAAQPLAPARFDAP